MEANKQEKPPAILIIATLSGGYKGADGVGQMHAEYPPNTYILPVICPSMFPEDFYLRTFERGINAIIIMVSGSDCPYKDGASKTVEIVNRTYQRMQEVGLDIQRLRLAAICTVCTTPFQKEVRRMEEILGEIGSIERLLTLRPAIQPQPA
ncbi:MAG: hydrogenase iron-sulfur subunit [Candidatus Promineifilaceae bacterium]